MSPCTSWPERVVARDLVRVWPLACDLARRDALASVHASQLILGHLFNTSGASEVQPGSRRSREPLKWR
eukprot:3963950-Prymnesium_polylepis.1